MALGTLISIGDTPKRVAKDVYNINSVVTAVVSKVDASKENRIVEVSEEILQLLGKKA